MYEIEDISLRHQEISADNYCSAVNGGASPTMDLYFSTSDSFSLQEMLDIDIKNEMDTDINFSFTDIPLLEHEEGSADFTWFSNNSNHSNSNLLEFGSDQVIMVNPNQVLKNPRALQQKEDLSLNPQLPVPSPSPKQSHLTFSPAAIKLTNIKPDITAVKKDLTENLGNLKTINRACENIITPTIKASLSKPINIITAKTVITKPAQQSFLNNQSIRISTSKSFNSNVNITRVEALTPRHIISNNGISRKVNSKYRNEDENPFPKPTYSYSCLIAMALKNSRTGSLPVSEIYNFMCQHFPYFKTAPNGWKNSVRHNLSLNKCFEKIEKPATSGAQRKGCLWAMHPDKISKMDEEVQKWSRKDPAAIKRAMVYPENLESLERGELKYGSESYGDSCGSGGSDSEGETENEAEEYDGEVSQQEHNITINEDAVSQQDYVEIGSLADSYDEVGDHMYDEIEVVNDQEALRVEVALAQRELFKFEESRVSPSKRFRTSGNTNGETVHLASGGRRKTPLLVRNNSNTSFIEIGVTD